MNFYLIIGSIITLLYFFRKNNTSFFYTIGIFLFFISACRDRYVGIDQDAYRDAFSFDIRYFPVRTLLFKFEFGWIFLNKVVIFCSNQWSSMLVIISLLTVIPICYVIRKNSPDPLLSLWMYFVLYYFILPFSILKQGVAISLFFLAVYFFNKELIKKSLVTFFLSCSIHYSALLLAPAIYLAKKINLKPKFVIISLTVSFILGVIGFDSSLRSLISLIPFEKYAHYSDYKADVEFDRLNIYLYLLPKNIACGFFFWYLRDRKLNIYKNLFLFGMVVGNLFVAISLVSRFLLYLYPLEIILLSYLVYSFKKAKNRSLVRILVMIYCMLFFLYNLFINRGGVIPYQFNF